VASKEGQRDYREQPDDDDCAYRTGGYLGFLILVGHSGTLCAASIIVATVIWTRNL
jgi:hypothetical protein